MNPEKKKQAQKERRKRRVKAKIFGTAERPRISVFRSNKHLYCQLINDADGKTLCAVDDSKLDDKSKARHVKVEAAHQLGLLIAKKAQEKGIKKAIFARGSYKYHGRVKALAEGAREGGLEF